MENKDLEYYRKNADDAFELTPICVLRYIDELESELKKAYEKGYKDATSEAIREINKNYKPIQE